MKEYVVNFLRGIYMLVVPIALLLGLNGCNQEQEFRFSGEYPPVTQVVYEQDGYAYSVDAIEGQVCVWFEDGVSHKKAKQAIEEAGGTIVSQIPEYHYYLVSTNPGGESLFMQDIQANTITECVYPNAVSYPCVATPYVMDNFNYVYPKYNATHGRMVADAISSSEMSGSVKRYEVGKDGERSMVWEEIKRDLKDILDGITDEDQPVINMSFTQELDKNTGKKWAEATNDMQNNYRSKYIAEIKNLLAIIKHYDDKDFIIVKAAGNEGVRDFEKEILKPLYKELNAKQRSMMDKHFLFVAALDGEKTYSNDLKKGTSHDWVTKVDISNYKYNNLHVPGTSIASPRAACYLISVAQKYDLKVTEVLQYAKKATQQHPEHLLTEEMLEELVAAEKEVDSGKKTTIEGVLRMYLLDNYVDDGEVIYNYDNDGKVTSFEVYEDPEHSYMRKIQKYQETDGYNEYLAFVVETNKAIDVTPYLEDDMFDEFFDNPIQSAFMVVPRFQYSGKDFAEKYANKRVKVTGTLYVPGAGWRNATEVVMEMQNITIVEGKTINRRQNR